MAIKLIRDAVGLAADISKLKEQREVAEAARLASLYFLYVEVMQNLEVLSVLDLEARPSTDDIYASVAVALTTEAHEAALAANFGAGHDEEEDGESRWGGVLRGIFGRTQSVETVDEGEAEQALATSQQFTTLQALRFVVVKVGAMRRIAALPEVTDKLRRDRIRYGVRLKNILRAEQALAEVLTGLDEVQGLRRPARADKAETT